MSAERKTDETLTPSHIAKLEHVASCKRAWFVNLIDVHALDLGWEYELLKEIAENFEMDASELAAYRKDGDGTSVGQRVHSAAFTELKLHQWDSPWAPKERPDDFFQLQAQTQAALEFLEDVLRARIMEGSKLDASFNRLDKPGKQPLGIAIGTSLLHVATGTFPCVQTIWNAMALSVAAKRNRLAFVFLLLLPVWMSLIRLYGIVVCPSRVLNFSSFGCVDEDVFVEDNFSNFNGNSSAATTCPTVGWFGCSIAFAEIVGAMLVLYVSHFAWRVAKAKTNKKVEKLEPLLAAESLGGQPANVNQPALEAAEAEATKVSETPTRENDAFDQRFLRWLWMIGSVEFTVVPGFLLLGFYQHVQVGTCLIYAMYVMVCLVNYWATMELASMHDEVKEAWSAKWKERLQVPFIGIRVPISPLFQTFVLCIPAFTDNSALSLAIGEIQAIWDHRLQCTWQATWQNLPVLSTVMACMSLPQTLGALMLFGLFSHIGIFIPAMDTNPRVAAEVASLSILSQIHEVHAVIEERKANKQNKVTEEEEIVY